MLTLVAERSSILIADGNEQWLLQAATGNDKLFLWHYARRKRRENPYGAMSDENRRNRWFNLNKIRRNCDVIFLTEICVKGFTMFGHVTYFLVFFVVIGVSDCTIRTWTVSSATYGTACSTLITDEYNATLKKIETFKPKADACAVKVNASVKACVQCLKKQSCGDSGMFAWLSKITYIGDPYKWGPGLEKGLTKLSQKIASGMSTIYKKYGKSAIQGLKNGFDSIGGAFKSFGKIIGTGLKVRRTCIQAWMSLNSRQIQQLTTEITAIEYLENKHLNFSSVANESILFKLEDKEDMHNILDGLISTKLNHRQEIFGKRRRSVDTEPIDNDESMDNVLLVRDKRAAFNLTSKEKKCMNKCSSCSAFTSGVEETTMRAICGDALVNENKTLTNDMTQLTDFYTEYQNATLPLLKKGWVNDINGKVTKFIALKDGTYHTYYPTNADNITLDLWNQDPTYMKIAKYMYKQYAVST